jgi:hypothetical protein
VADLTKTITNSLLVWGPAQPDVWNAHLWNAFLWGEGTAGTVKTPAKVLAETVTPTDSLVLNTLFYMTLSNSLTPASDPSYERLSDSAGYSVVFPGGVVSGEDRVSSTWASASETAPSWSSGTATSTSWSAS